MKKFFSSSFLFPRTFFALTHMHDREAGMHLSFAFSYLPVVAEAKANKLCCCICPVIVCYKLSSFVYFAKSYIYIVFFPFFSYLTQDEVFTMRKILYYLKMRLFHHKRCCLLWDEPFLQRAILTKVKDFWTVKFPHIFYHIDFKPFQKIVYAKLIISSNTHKHTDTIRQTTLI